MPYNVCELIGGPVDGSFVPISDTLKIGDSFQVCPGVVDQNGYSINHENLKIDFIEYRIESNWKAVLVCKKD